MKRKVPAEQLRWSQAAVTEQVLAQLADLQDTDLAQLQAEYQANGDLVIDSKQAEWIAAQLEEVLGTELLGEAALDPYRLTSVKSLGELFCSVLSTPARVQPGASA